MTRWKMWIFGALALLGTAAAIAYASVVAPTVRTRAELAILVFTASAAGIGWLGLIVSWLTYRLEAGRVPRPDVQIIDEGTLVKHWKVRVRGPSQTPHVEEVAANERKRLAEAREKAQSYRPRGLLALSGWTAPSEEDFREFDQKVEGYLRDLEEYGRQKFMFDLFWSVTRPLLLAFTNDRGGAPAEGVLVRLIIPEDGGIAVADEGLGMKEPKRPTPPMAPSGHSLGGLASLVEQWKPLDYPRLLDTGLGGLKAREPPGNVSDPTVEKGTVEYRVQEILHNVPEDNRDAALLVHFNRAGTWHVRYEVHARNLRTPRRAKLTIEAIDEDGVLSARRDEVTPPQCLRP